MTLSKATDRAPERPAAGSAMTAGVRQSRMRRSVVWIADMGRYAGARAIVGLADLLPRRAAIATVRGLAFIETALSARGRSARAEARTVMGLPRREAFKMAWSWISVPYLDLIDLRRVSQRREDLSRWKIEEINREPTYALLDQRAPLLGVGGHFSLGALLPLAERFPEIAPIGALDPIEPFALRGDVLLRRLMMGMVHGLGDVLMPGRVKKSFVGQSDVQGDMLASLSQPGGIGFIMIDIDWKRAWAFHRPFCGYGDRGFALGATRIARLAQVPTVMIAAERVGDRHSRAYFSDPIAPPPADAVETDLPRMSELLDQLETYIGRLRHAYPHPIGWERRWNRETERWEPRS